jgi:glycosyltransferase involved in cell wall biosynthesis
LLDVPPSRIRVVPHGVSIPPSDPALAREKIVLHVGAIQHRKNISRLVAAFEQLDPGWRLILAGAAGFGAQEILRRINESPRRREIEILGYVADRRLAELYAQAAIFAFPSLDEGFGMPVLDAMAAGLPVLTSDRSATAEVAADAALLVDPVQTSAIAEGLRRMARDESLRQDLTRRGMDRAAQFTWEQAVRRTWDCYRELLG